MRRVIVGVLAVIGVVVFSDRAQANWKWKDAGCVWDQNDNGPDECNPNLPMGEPPQVTEGTQPQSQGQLSGGSGNFGTEALQSCRAYTRQGNVGYVSVQVNPADGSLAWGAYMNNPLDNYGWWTAGVYVNGSLVDSKNQFYPPHASLPSSRAPAGSTVFITVQHLYFIWGIVPIYIPEFGWTFIAEWIPSVAYGTLQCTMPFAGF